MSKTSRRTPSLISKKDYLWSLVGITALLFFIAVMVTLTLYKSGPLDNEIYVFPNSTYICTNKVHDDTQEKVCTLKTTTATPPGNTITSTPNTFKTEVSG